MQTPIKYGIMAGIIMIALLMLIYIIDAGSIASMFSIALYLPLVFLMIWGGITYRKELGGYKSFMQAFVAVLLISVIATFMFESYSYILSKFIDPDLPDLIKQKAIENATSMMEKFGAPPDQIDEATERMEAQSYTPTMQTLLYRYAISLVVGLFFSMLIALFVRRSDRRPQPKAE